MPSPLSAEFFLPLLPTGYTVDMPDLPKNIAEIDSVLIQYADVESAAAISFRIGGLLTPSQVAARIDHLVEVPDRLSLLQQDQLVTLKMRRVVAQLEEMMNDHRGTSRVAEVLLSGLERVGNRLDRRQKATEAELSTLYAFQGVFMLEAISEALAVMRHELTESGEPEERIDPDRWDAALVKGLRVAQLKVASAEAGSRPEDSGVPVEMPTTVSGNSISDHARQRQLESRRDYQPAKPIPAAMEEER